jgi:hypothetical protein
MKTTSSMLTVVIATIAGGVWEPALNPGARLQAQEEQEVEGPRIGCFRGRPLPTCKSFWLVEMQGFTPLGQTTRSVSYSDGQPVEMTAFEGRLEWNVGHMVNLSPTFALGGTLSVGPHGGSGIFTGLKVRARQWLSEDLSLELAGGLLEYGQHYPSSRGATADVRINVRDQGAFFVRWDGVSLPGVQYPDASYFDEGGFQQAISVGAAAGSVPALIATGALGLGYVIVLGLFLADSN